VWAGFAVYFLADEKHSRCLTEKVYLPTIVCGRVLWHLGYTEDASAVAFTQSYGEFQRAASQQEPAYRVRGTNRVKISVTLVDNELDLVSPGSA
jgi:hypothetical protein